METMFINDFHQAVVTASISLLSVLALQKVIVKNCHDLAAVLLFLAL